MNKFSYVEAIQELVVSFIACEGEIKVLEKLLEKKNVIKRREQYYDSFIWENVSRFRKKNDLRYLPTESEFY